MFADKFTTIGCNTIGVQNDRMDEQVKQFYDVVMLTIYRLDELDISEVRKCAMTGHRYGEIIGRYVIYRGDSAVVEGIQYMNVEEYLKSL